jgi:hypothetical protein
MAMNIQFHPVAAQVGIATWSVTDSPHGTATLIVSDHRDAGHGVTCERAQLCNRAIAPLAGSSSPLSDRITALFGGHPPPTSLIGR